MEWNHSFSFTYENFFVYTLVLVLSGGNKLRSKAFPAHSTKVTEPESLAIKRTRGCKENTNARAKVLLFLTGCFPL